MSTKELKPSQAAQYNRNSDKAAYVIPYGGTPEDPEYLYPEELEAAVVTADLDESRKLRAEKEASAFRDRRLIGHIGGDRDLDMGSGYVQPLKDVATIGIGSSLLGSNPITGQFIEGAANVGSKTLPHIDDVVSWLSKSGTKWYDPRHIGQTIFNPRNAYTAGGEALATGFDLGTAGLGLQAASNRVRNWRQNGFNWRELPQFAMEASSMLPILNYAGRIAGTAGRIGSTTGVIKNNSFGNGSWHDPGFDTQSPDEILPHKQNVNDFVNDFLQKSADAGEHPLAYARQHYPNSPYAKAFIKNYRQYPDAIKTADDIMWASFPEIKPTGSADLLTEYYKTQSLPRLLKAFEDSGVTLNQQEIDFLTQLYSNPIGSANIRYGFMSPDIHGYHVSNTDDVFLSPRHVHGLDSPTSVHEIHHFLRNFIKRKLSPDYFVSTKDMSTGLLNADPARNMSVTNTYTKAEIDAMEPMGWYAQYDVSPTAETGAVMGGDARYKLWLELRKELGRTPTVQEMNDYIDAVSVEDIYRNFPAQQSYGSMIGEVPRTMRPTTDDTFDQWYHKVDFANKWKHLMKTIGMFTGAGYFGTQYSNNEKTQP